jgi:hypothetical protein
VMPDMLLACWYSAWASALTLLRALPDGRDAGYVACVLVFSVGKRTHAAAGSSRRA